MANTTEYAIAEYFKSDGQMQIDDEDDMNSLVILTICIAFIVGILFVIINWRIDTKKQPAFPDMTFYPVSLIKLITLSFITFGIYTVYWFYRNWLYKKKIDGSSIMPMARGIFSAFWYYPLYQSLVLDSTARYQENRVLIKPLAILFALLYLSANFLGYLDSFWGAVVFITPLLLLPLANYINHINDNDLSAYRYNSRWLLRHSILAILILPICVLVLGIDLNVIPSSHVVTGDRIMVRDIKFMQRKGVLQADEKIEYFYSDALLNIRDDGNGFTDKHVFSYWKDKEAGFKFEREALSKVQDINATYSKEWGENTVITLKKENGNDFVLFVSREKGLDKKFVTELKDRWRKSRGG